MRSLSTSTIVAVPAVASLAALVMVFTSYRASQAVIAPRESAVPADVVVEPGPESATLTPVVTARECEGAGDAVCVVTVRPMLSWNGPALPAGETWTLRYRIDGLLDGKAVRGELRLKDGRVSGVDKVVTVAGRDAVIGVTAVSLIPSW